MYQSKWLRWQVHATYASGAWMFHGAVSWLWGQCPVRDDADALGCVLMGGEL